MKIVMTLDYELFNGINSGTVSNCLITPCDELLKVLDKYDFKATFFVDTVFLVRLIGLKDYYPELQEDWDRIKSQLIRLVEGGHDLQLHLHPQWYHASYNNGLWKSVLTDYKLSDMSPDEVDDMFEKGISLMRDITGRPVSAFRAGAYCIQTLPYLNTVFSQHKIRIDSSVNRNKASKTIKYQWYDYTRIPDSYLYQFNEDVTTSEDNGIFTEVSIPSYHISLYRFYLNYIKRKLSKFSKTHWGDGTGSIGTLEGRKSSLKARILNYIRPSRIAASIDAANADNLDWIFHLEMKKGSDYMMIMGHPKALTPYSLYRLNKFLSRYAASTENVTISDF